MITDPHIMLLRPSAVACGALVAAARGLNIASKDQVLEHVCRLANTAAADVLLVVDRVEANVQEHQRAAAIQMAQQQQQQQQHQKLVSGNSSLALDIIIDDNSDAEASKPVTPTDIQDIYFD